MTKISIGKRSSRYHEIYELIYDNPKLPNFEVAKATGFSRNTIATYLHEMATNEIMRGPQLSIQPAENYREYVYLMDFKDPFQVYEGLKRFPHVLYHAMTFGSWNTLIISDMLMDFRKLIGSQNVKYFGARGFSYAPKVNYLLWNEAFEKMYKKIEEFAPERIEKKRRVIVPAVNWNEKQWKLYYAFKDDLRRRASPILKRTRIHRQDYVEWARTLKAHCTIQTRFYPLGYCSYANHWFVFSSSYESVIKDIFSFLPTSSLVMEFGDQLMVSCCLPGSDMTREILKIVSTLEAKGITSECCEAIVVLEHQH